MNWILPRSWVLLGVLFLVSLVVALDSGSHADPPQTTSLEQAGPDRSSDRSRRSAKDAKLLVSEAQILLRALDPAPSPRLSESSESITRTIWGIAKRILLWHTPESLEEPGDGDSRRQLSGGADGKKLRLAVKKLERAAEAAQNDDALFLLAEMNFYGNWSHPRDYQTAFRRYKELADLSGNHTAQNMVGFIYATGIGGAVKRDQAKALLYHTFAALNGNTRSEMTIAFRHYTGIGTPRNCEEAAYFYQRVAEKALTWYESGPLGGQHLPKHTFRLADDVGGVYGEGASAVSSGLNAARSRMTLDSSNDMGDVVEYLELMARKGNLPETFSLGKLYYDGSRRLTRNLPRAKEYFLRVARQYWNREGKAIAGSPTHVEKWAGRAAGYLGNMALKGEAGPQDFRTARTWFQRGVETGDANSINGLGYMYLYGFGVKADRQKAVTFFKTATKYDFPAAQVNMAKLLLKQGDVDVAKRYLELAARHGNVEAFYYLAEINNSGVAKDRSCNLATAYYKIVVEKVEPLQSPMAWANEMNEKGDKESALVGYMMAAEQGYESGQANVAYLLDEERSALPLPEVLSGKKQKKRRRDKELALIYWTRSAKQANTDSLVKMGDYYLTGIGTDPDPEKAASCYIAASEHQASAQALWNLGWMHENGVGMEQDFHLAKRFYDLSFETNHEAYLPVTLSLLKLRLRSFWNTLTHGGVPGIGPDEDKKPRLTLREFFWKWYNAPHENPMDRPAGDDVGPVDDTEHIPGDEYFDEAYTEDLAESIIILGLAGAVAALVYYRQWRAQAAARRRREEEQERRRQAGLDPLPPPPQPEVPEGIWGDGMPGWGMPH